MKEFKFGKSLLSAYYISILVSFFIFAVSKEIIGSISSWILSFFAVMFGFKAQGNGLLWTWLFIVCFLILILIRKFVVEKLDFFAKDEFEKSWQIWIFGMLILGFFIYIINLSFPSQPMPSDWWPEWLIRFFGGYKNTFPDKFVLSVEEKNFWQIVPYIWHLGPISFLYFTSFKKN